MAHKNRENRSPWKDRQQEREENSSKVKHRGNRSSKASGGQASASGGRTSQPLRGRHRQPTQSFSFQEADDRIYDAFRHHGFGDFPHELRLQLTRFYQLLIENHKVNNFTRLIKIRDVAIKHFIDSLIVLRLCEEHGHSLGGRCNQRSDANDNSHDDGSDLSLGGENHGDSENAMGPLLDMGTGPGFPGIPLKIASPDLKVILAEGVQSRVSFLKKVRDDLKLKNLDIIGRNIDESFVYPVQGVITRAVEDIRNTLGNVISCVQTGGHVYLMKGPNVDPELEPAMEAWGKYYELAHDIEYVLPKTRHERRLLIYKKIKSRPLPAEIDLLD